MVAIIARERRANTLQLPNYITPSNKARLGKLLISPLVKKVPTFYGMWKFITVFTTARHLTLS
jgi:hypothetical protein